MKKLYSVAHNWRDDEKIKEELEQAGTLPIKLKLRLQKRFSRLRIEQHQCVFLAAKSHQISTWNLPLLPLCLKIRVELS